MILTGSALASDRGAQALGEHGRELDGDIGLDHAELFAAHPRDQHVIAGAWPQPPREAMSRVPNAVTSESVTTPPQTRPSPPRTGNGELSGITTTSSDADAAE